MAQVIDYRTFCEASAEGWEAFESLLGQIRQSGLSHLNHQDLERFAAHHRRITSDFAFARTHFPRTDAEHRLRVLAFSGHRLLSQRHEPIVSQIWAFYRDGYRQTFRSCFPSLGIAAAVFIGATLLGFVITLVNPGFAGLFLGPDMIEGLRQGEIWTDSVTKVVPPAVLSGRIMTNNMSVALVAWLGGATLGLLSVVSLMTNGLMFGSVLFLTWQYHLLENLLAFVAAHGPLELSLIVVAGAAGFELTRGQIGQPHLLRSVSFRRGARRSLKLVAMTLPWFVLLGLVEGYISPVMTIPPLAKALAGGLLWLAFVAYALAPPPADPSLEDLDCAAEELE